MGGDLNLKKSWHPHLLKNQERVWQEENKALEERKRTEQWRKEREEERQLQELRQLQEAAGGKKVLDRVEFLYSGPSQGMDRTTDEMEAYLLGKRRIDSLLKGSDNEKLSKQASETSFMAIQNANTVRDTANKIREDPLLAIKKQEQAAYEAFMKDPVKRRQLKEVAEGGKEKSRDTRDKERDRKHRSHRHRDDDRNSRRSSHRDDDRNRRGSRRDRDDDRKHHHRRRHSSSRSRSRSSTPPRRKASSKSRASSRSRSPLRESRDYRRRSSPDHERRRTRSPPTGRRNGSSSHRRPPSRSPRRRSPVPPPRDSGDYRSRPQRQPYVNRSNGNGNENRNRNGNGNGNGNAEEERARKLAAMQSNADQMNAERVKRLAEITEKEKAELEKEEAARMRNSKYGGKGDFLTGVNRKAGNLDLGERVRRGRQTLIKGESDD
ncbi:uncharacterized protein H6S33_005647 [Morchella sextelata]|uniref:uncharacterized protein n=1 Tax=Morchella sextelata TaxID=1174677 RepID=UPI001D048AB9|nr:uncharacterized protein H6S33_005647 [Morchella sextelata]KAH0613761.1 hypothetical protein H6S33_005647 [Morchella sextelata]